MTQDIEFREEHQFGIIALKRPQALNALNLSMILALKEKLMLWQHKESIHAVLIYAQEGKAFCAGGDVRWIYEAGKAGNPQQLQFFEQEYQLNLLIHQFKKPYIALLDGITMGGGVGISLHGAFSIASERFSFAMPETSIGLFPDVGASFLLNRSPKPLGLFLALTGQRLNAEEALAARLITHHCQHQDFPALFESLLHLDLRRHAADHIQECIAAYRQMPSVSFAHIDKIQELFQGDTLSEIIQTLTSSVDPFARETLAILQQKSPTSLAVTCIQMQRASALTLAQCLELDNRLVRKFMKGHDFYEGVRALLIDKDKDPHWQPAHIEALTSADIAAYFEEN